jgi:hypothetical protein
MISAKRIVEIFRTRGGGDEFTLPAVKLPPEQFAYLANVSEGEPIVAKVSAENEWFVLTKSLLVFDHRGEIRKIRFDQILAVDIPKSDLLNPRSKIGGGNLDVGLQDGTTFRFKVEPGGPYLGLMNVLTRIATVNRRQSSRVGPGNQSVPSASNDQRSTTAL